MIVHMSRRRLISFMGEHLSVNTNFFADGETYDCEHRGGNDNCAANQAAAWPIIFSYADSAQGRADLGAPSGCAACPRTTC